MSAFLRCRTTLGALVRSWGKVPSATPLQVHGPRNSLLALSMAALLSAGYFTLNPNYRGDPFAYYALFLLELAALGGVISFVVSRRAGYLRLDGHGLLIGAAFFFLALTLGLHHIDALSIWLDEEVQVNVAKGVNGSIVRGAAFTQMPLSYYFTALGLRIFNSSEWGARFFSALFFAWSAVVFFRLAGIFAISRLVAILVTVAYIFNPWAIRYAQEARPYSLAMLCGLLWIGEAYAFVARGGRERALGFFSATLLLLLSISFQSVIFIVSFFPLVAMLCAVPGVRRRGLEFLFLETLALVLVAPIVLFVRARSVKFLSLGIDWPALRISPESLSKFFAHGGDLFRWNAAMSVAMVMVVLTGLPIIIARVRSRDFSEREIATVFISLALAVFGVLFWLLFSLLIHYEISTRYYLLALPLGLFASAGWIDLFFRNLGSGKRWPIFLSVTFFAMALLASELGDLPSSYRAWAFDRWNVDYRSLFAQMRENGRAGDLGYVVPYQRPGNWEQVGFLATQFYSFAGDPVRITNQWNTKAEETLVSLVRRDLDKSQPQHVFLYFADLHADEDALLQYFSKTPDVKVISGDGFYLFMLNVREGLAGTLNTFFHSFVQLAQHKENTYRIYDLLITLAELRGDVSEADHYTKDLENVGREFPEVLPILRAHHGI